MQRRPPGRYGATCVSDRCRCTLRLFCGNQTRYSLTRSTIFWAARTRGRQCHGRNRARRGALAAARTRQAWCHVCHARISGNGSRGMHYRNCGWKRNALRHRTAGGSGNPGGRRGARRHRGHRAHLTRMLQGDCFARNCHEGPWPCGAIQRPFFADVLYWSDRGLVCFVGFGFWGRVFTGLHTERRAVTPGAPVLNVQEASDKSGGEESSPTERPKKMTRCCNIREKWYR
jgi:hypothetical protein